MTPTPGQYRPLNGMAYSRDRHLFCKHVPVLHSKWNVNIIWYVLILDIFCYDSENQNHDLYCAQKRIRLPPALAHLPSVPHIYASESGQHWFRLWPVSYSVPSRYLNQCWVIDNWTLRWNLFKIQNVSFTKMHMKISSAKWRPFCRGRDELASLFF